MSNVSIYDKNWTELVFADKNKAYGAYQLRQENSRTTLLAFFVGISFIFALFGSWVLLSSFAEKPVVEPVYDKPLIVKMTDYKIPKKEPQKTKAIAPIKKEEPAKKIDKKTLDNYTVVKPEDTPNDVKTNKEAKENPSDVTTTDANGTGTKAIIPSDSGAGTTTTKKSTGDGEGTKSMVELDRLPEYPGGIKKFYEFVLNNVEESKFENSSGIVSVTMAFVIEKDGSMSDIRVVRSSDKALEKEAIRVLKSLKVKWAPGFLNGDKVRTQYTLPIKVDLN